MGAYSWESTHTRAYARARTLTYAHIRTRINTQRARDSVRPMCKEQKRLELVVCYTVMYTAKGWTSECDCNATHGERNVTLFET